MRPFEQITCQARRRGNAGEIGGKAKRWAFAAVHFWRKMFQEDGGFSV
jgi:hypothetical protein